MGCGWFKMKLPCFKRSGFSLQESPVKQYSWDKREALNKGDFMIENLTDQTVIKNANSINGQQFIIQNCKGCSIVLQDHSSSVTIDDCSGCFIFLGPVKTSCFIRNSSDCQLVVACQQLRTRDCKKLQIHLCCTSQPSIEASTNLSFQCYQCHYPLIAEHFREAALNEYNNNWSNIHDFTPTSHQQLNYSILPIDSSYESHLHTLPSDLGISASPTSSFVPFTHALQSTLTQESCLVVFSKEPCHKIIISTFLSLIKQGGCMLVRSREVECCKTINERLFNQSHQANLPTNGSLICLEVVGENVTSKCNTAVTKTKEIVANGVVGGDSGDVVLGGDERRVGSGLAGHGGLGEKLGGMFKRKRDACVEKRVGVGFVYVSEVREAEGALSAFHAIIKSQMGF